MSNNLPDIKILYEDAGCVVVDKPAGLMVHPDGRDKGPFLTDWVIEKYPDAVNVGEHTRTPDGEPILRPGIVHRLDRETSGALIIAKTSEAHAALKAQFQDRTVTKKYLAFVWGEVTEEFGTISRSIGRSSSDFRKWSAQRGARGDLRDAETYWTRLATNRVETEGKDEKFSLVEVEPKTGRTHQIRVHFTAVNHPVVGDSLYAPKRSMALGFARTALHARSLEFDTLDGKRVKIVAPLPDDFIGAAKLLGAKIKE
ncbi:MAG: RluA family pseudouridine synthase [Candidatus Pacebacteria bacterium]|nr:RluA family pseudouridine synthase [Candidatus Paceibacterota bacterium]